MTFKPIELRTSAREDVDAATDHYITEGGEAVAYDFVDALERCYRSIEAHPAAGSPRYSEQFGLAGLRHRALRRFPYLIFYVEQKDRIDVWRVLHARRDIPASFQT